VGASVACEQVIQTALHRDAAIESNYRPMDRASLASLAGSVTGRGPVTDRGQKGNSFILP
jgi:hypothetical protein